MTADVADTQKIVCSQHGVAFLASPPESKVGIAANVRSELQPLNGLRHHPEGDTTGWYIWAGEAFSDDPDFFMPLHVEHLVDWCPAIMKYLGLPPGWRFLVANGHEDVWFDSTLVTDVR